MHLLRLLFLLLEFMLYVSGAVIEASSSREGAPAVSASNAPSFPQNNNNMFLVKSSSLKTDLFDDIAVQHFQCFGDASAGNDTLLFEECSQLLRSTTEQDEMLSPMEFASLDFWRRLHQARLQNDFPALLLWTQPVPKNRGDSAVVESLSWQHFVWDQGSWISFNDTNISTFSSHVLGAPPEDKQVVSSSTFRLSSELSESGGMHRRLHHTLEFLQIATQVLEEQQSQSFTLDILVHIPSDVFVNVEDAYEVTVKQTEEEEEPIHRPTVELVVDNTKVIDQEEPSFVSPSHVVVYRISGHNPRSKTTGESPFVLLQWDTLLHLRYPSPVSAAADNPLTWITMLAPQIVSVSYNSNETSDQPVTFLSLLPEAPPIVFQVAAGYASDLFPVLLVTVGVSIFGTLWLLRDMARISSLQQR